MDTPIHYRLNIEPVEYIMANDMPYAEGNVVKYVSRHGLKGGAEDIKKAIKYCTFILDRTYGIETFVEYEDEVMAELIENACVDPMEFECQCPMCTAHDMDEQPDAPYEWPVEDDEDVVDQGDGSFYVRFPLPYVQREAW